MSIEAVSKNSDYQRIKQLLAVGHRVSDGKTREFSETFSSILSGLGIVKAPINEEQIQLAALANYEATGNTTYKFRDANSKLVERQLDFKKIKDTIEEGADKEGKSLTFGGRLLKFGSHAVSKLAETFLIHRDEVGRVSLTGSALKMAGTYLAAAYLPMGMALGTAVLGAGFPVVVTAAFGVMTAGFIINGLSKMSASQDKHTNEVYDGAADVALGALGGFGIVGEWGRAMNVWRSGGLKRAQVALETLAGTGSEATWFGSVGKMTQRFKGLLNSDKESRLLILSDYRQAQAGISITASISEEIKNQNRFNNELYEYLKSEALKRDPKSEFDPTKLNLADIKRFLADKNYGGYSLIENQSLLKQREKAVLDELIAHAVEGKSSTDRATIIDTVNKASNKLDEVSKIITNDGTISAEAKLNAKNIFDEFTTYATDLLANPQYKGLCQSEEVSAVTRAIQAAPEEYSANAFSSWKNFWDRLLGKPFVPKDTIRKATICEIKPNGADKYEMILETTAQKPKNWYLPWGKTEPISAKRTINIEAVKITDANDPTKIIRTEYKVNGFSEISFGQKAVTATRVDNKTAIQSVQSTYNLKPSEYDIICIPGKNTSTVDVMAVKRGTNQIGYFRVNADSKAQILTDAGQLANEADQLTFVGAGSSVETPQPLVATDKLQRACLQAETINDLRDINGYVADTNTAVMSTEGSLTRRNLKRNTLPTVATASNTPVVASKILSNQEAGLTLVADKQENPQNPNYPPGPFSGMALAGNNFSSMFTTPSGVSNSYQYGSSSLTPSFTSFSGTY